MTKTQLCKAIVKEHERKTGRTVRAEDVVTSSRLSVAMEHLGRLEGDFLEYAKSRAGIMFVCVDEKPPQETEIVTLTLRDILELLPE